MLSFQHHLKSRAKRKKNHIILKTRKKVLSKAILSRGPQNSWSRMWFSVGANASELSYNELKYTKAEVCPQKQTLGPQNNTLPTCWASQVGRGWTALLTELGPGGRQAPCTAAAASSFPALRWLQRRCEAAEGNTDHIPSQWEWTFPAWQLSRGKAGRQCPVAPASSCGTAEVVLESVWAMDFLSPAYINLLFQKLVLTWSGYSRREQQVATR